MNELRGESPTDCETAYESALWMLYALLDDTLTGASSTTPLDPAAEEDRATVNRFVASIGARLKALRKKIAPMSATTTTTVISGASTPLSGGTTVVATSPPA